MAAGVMRFAEQERVWDDFERIETHRSILGASFFLKKKNHLNFANLQNCQESFKLLCKMLEQWVLDVPWSSQEVLLGFFSNATPPVTTRESVTET